MAGESFKCSHPCLDKKTAQHTVANIWSTLSGRTETEKSSCSLQLFGVHEYQCTELTPSTLKSIKDDNKGKNSLCLSFQSPNETFTHI